MNILSKIGNFLSGCVKTLWLYWKELWFIRIENGSVRYIASSKKFFATISQILFGFAVLLKIFANALGYPGIGAQISIGLIGILAGQASASTGWYTWAKPKDVQSVLEAVENESKKVAVKKDTESTIDPEDT